MSVPFEPSRDEEVLREIAHFWNIIDSLPHLEGALGGELIRLRTVVSDAMYCQPANLSLAMSATAELMLMLDAMNELPL